MFYYSRKAFHLWDIEIAGYLLCKVLLFFEKEALIFLYLLIYAKKLSYTVLSAPKHKCI